MCSNVAMCLTPVLGPSESQIKQTIAKEETAKTAQPGHVAKDKVSDLGFVVTALELEDTQ